MRRSPDPSHLTIEFSTKRAFSFSEFAEALAVPNVDLGEDTLAELYSQTSGWVLAALAVIDGARSQSISLDSIDPAQYQHLISVRVLNEIRLNARDTAGHRLAHLVSLLHTVTPKTVELANTAVPLIGQLKSETGIDTTNAMFMLLDNGILRPSEVAPEGFVRPPVLRSVLRRYFDHKDGHSESRSRRALGTVFAEVAASPTAFGTAQFDEALLQAAENRKWDALSRAWGAHAHALLAAHLESATTAFSSIPSEVEKRSRLIEEAVAATREVTRVRREQSTDDPATILRLASFEEKIGNPLPSQLGAIRSGKHSADDIAVMAISSMQHFVNLGEGARAVELGGIAGDAMRSHECYSRPASRLSDARYHLQLGITQLNVGDIPSSTFSLRRAILIGESIAGTTPHILAAAYSYSALAHIATGSGGLTDQHLREFDALEKAQPFVESIAVGARALARLVRALDVLDLDCATAAAAILAQPGIQQSIQIPAILYNSILAIYLGRPRLEEKRLNQVIDSNARFYDHHLSRFGPLQVARVYLYLAQGRTHLTQTEIIRTDATGDESLLAQARLHLSVGDYTTAEGLAARLRHRKNVPIRIKASTQAITAACLFQTGQHHQARVATLDTLEYCRVATTLLPLALLPKSIRDALVDTVPDAAAWDSVAEGFDNPAVTGALISHRISALGETFPLRCEENHLSFSEIELLAMMDSTGSVTALAEASGLVHGTVKNKLSRLYKLLGVRSWKSAIEFGYENGYLPAENSRAAD